MTLMGWPGRSAGNGVGVVWGGAVRTTPIVVGAGIIVAGVGMLGLCVLDKEGG